ncbi:MAG: bifunctional diaminohydroxyphosphoribosylaminopyrimidine deaminase/5-amino-6-(5-phosphoribosylamino)uracil reductase RibD [Gemmatimonadota bacterium]|nr:bifunctional diaminohydroxyphosphoribosylaminopyrimidine deaminase/5-amino-6-(5-phosphoribosylamino)uracil reductase RibD [Gemmatimonadota bacterium]MDE2863613.1 bifunctional diaminohydroxyphosphoribosylaminopyrimidine deaminase/5-amino-6-(5-phosphoribosylamino)uracil reductase RibD [Gemmatimonadota bacterium]MYB07157.1 bifunctional diaminohydroxyphosphoribosylaminopyrimidine deaminase/5-amino-6-(5-phosphoribosylamino)uracil reductase RibD [Gemmatimonadota bacterium]MYG21494.1 bifunctional di
MVGPVASSAASHLSDLDYRLLRRSILLGRRGWGRVHPNPMVGCVVARGREVLAEGYHALFGGPHAETTALAAVDNARGATLYSSLEPCNHVGKTPPCTEAIRGAGIERVVYWAPEPGSAAGGGAERLRRSGLRVDGPVGEWTDWAAENPFFFRDPDMHRPYLALKLAVSLDGYIAPGGGRRVWLTGPEARAEVHRLRAGFDAVLVGSGTWRADDPRLTARGEPVPRVPPLPVLLDRHGQATRGLRALRREGGARRPIVVTAAGQATRLQGSLGEEAEVVPVSQDGRGLDLEEALGALAERGVDTILCEGGGILAAALLEGGLVDRIYVFLAPCLIGAGGVPAFPVRPNAAGAADGTGERAMPEWRPRLEPVRFGNDTLVVLDRGA